MRTKNILSLEYSEALDVFMKSEQYHGFELPEYFTFDGVLQFVKNQVGTASYEECIKGDVLPNNLTDVNLDILLNKDGYYGRYKSY